MTWKIAYRFAAARTLELTALVGTTRKSAMSVMLTVLWLCASASQSTAQTYTITDLGTLPGNSVSKALALNDAGEAAGVSETPTAAIATKFSSGKATSISTLGSSVSIANGINGSGEIVGWNSYDSNANFDPQAFIYSNGSMLNINSATLFPSGTEAYGINSSGEVVGTGYLSGSNFHAFLYSGGRMEDIGPSGAFQASAYAINTSGQIVGSYSLNSGASGTFLYTNGKMTMLPNPAGSRGGFGVAINGNGEIVGELFPATAIGSHAGKFSNGAWIDLGNFTGAQGSEATAINTAGEIVGTAIFPPIYRPFRAGKHVAVISTTSGLVNLNTLIPAGSGFTLTDAVGINDSGQILCDATNASGQEHAVLLSLK
jgi:probable HAF family extracellular repeat protein